MLFYISEIQGVFLGLSKKATCLRGRVAEINFASWICVIIVCKLKDYHIPMYGQRFNVWIASFPMYGPSDQWTLRWSPRWVFFRLRMYQCMATFIPSLFICRWDVPYPQYKFGDNLPTPSSSHDENLCVCLRQFLRKFNFF